MWTVTTKMSGILSQLRQLTITMGRRYNFKTGSHHMYSTLTCFETRRHIVRVHQKGNHFCSAQDDVERKMTADEVRELKAIENIKNLSEDEKLKLERLKVEFLSRKAKLDKVPSEMTAYNWIQALRTETFTGRIKLYDFLSRKEYYKRKKNVEKLQKQEMEKPLTPRVESFLNRRHQALTMNRRKHSSKGCQSFSFGNPLVFDCSVREQSDREARLLMNQLGLCYGINLSHPEPFHLHFTGIPERGVLADTFEYRFMDPENYFIDFHEQDLCDVFPAERLVYLTPQSTNYLKYSADDIYVIGGLVDIHDTKPYTYSKAKKLGIRSASLPLDQYYRLKKCKSLTLDAVLNVMLELNYTRDWQKSMLKIPQRYWDIKKIKHEDSDVDEEIGRYRIL